MEKDMVFYIFFIFFWFSVLNSFISAFVMAV